MGGVEVAGEVVEDGVDRGSELISHRLWRRAVQGSLADVVDDHLEDRDQCGRVGPRDCRMDGGTGLDDGRGHALGRLVATFQDEPADDGTAGA